MEFRLTAEEFGAFQAAARRAGLSRGAYAAQTVLGAAYGIEQVPGASIRCSWPSWSAPLSRPGGSASI